MLLNFSLLIKISFVTHSVVIVTSRKVISKFACDDYKKREYIYIFYQYFRNQNTNITAAGPKKRYTAC